MAYKLKTNWDHPLKKSLQYEASMKYWMIHG
jgi:hypothetical protein